ncbi:MAG: D-sedoheptulose 7-phosphate isomerase [Abditibacteriota bacterium]|nr:D-sedoheptulose 7-phosphate isomerase [Abditibacteriota bacterium]
MRKLLAEQCRDAARVMQNVEAQLPQIEAIGALIIEALRNGGKILTCGNGGSAAEAQHFAEELVGRYKRERRSLPAVCLVADGTLLTCILNDYGADEIFARQSDSMACPGDVLVGFSTSGQSENVRRAIERTRARGVATVALLGRDGGATRGLADHEVIIESTVTARVQEAHLLVLHLLCELIDEAFV